MPILSGSALRAKQVSMLNTAAKRILLIMQFSMLNSGGIKKLEKPRNLALRTLDSNRNVGQAPRKLKAGTVPGLVAWLPSMKSSIGRLTTPTHLFYLLDSELGTLNLTRPGSAGSCDRSYHADCARLRAAPETATLPRYHSSFRVDEGSENCRDVKTWTQRSLTSAEMSNFHRPIFVARVSPLRVYVWRKIGSCQ
jgi:hypothetical protein